MWGNQGRVGVIQHCRWLEWGLSLFRTAACALQFLGCHHGKLDEGQVRLRILWSQIQRGMRMFLKQQQMAREPLRWQSQLQSYYLCP